MKRMFLLVVLMASSATPTATWAVQLNNDPATTSARKLFWEACTSRFRTTECECRLGVTGQIAAQAQADPHLIKNIPNLAKIELFYLDVQTEMIRLHNKGQPIDMKALNSVAIERHGFSTASDLTTSTLVTVDNEARRLCR